MVTLDTLTDRLSLACRLLDQASRDVRDLDAALPGNHIRQLAEAMAKVFEVQRAIFALRPDLEPAFLKEKSRDPEADRRLTEALGKAYALLDEARYAEALDLLRAFSGAEDSAFHRRIAEAESRTIEGLAKS
jgi:hypothetical protein